MKFHEFGDEGNLTIMLIHGGGNAWWNYLRQARVLADRYHVVLPTLDGHGEEFAVPYVSTEATADKLMEFIDTRCGGHVFALGGVSLGGQIVAELLSRKPDLAKKAIIDGSLCIPQPFMAHCCIAFMRLGSGLLFSEKACRRQVDSMPKMLPEKMQYPDEIIAHYLRDTELQVMYWYGEKEMKCVKRSARHFKDYVPTCELYEAPGYNHGYLALYLPDEWLALAVPFFERD
ncbi:alpha/beta fold hydrolase [Gordonibacter sp.]|uniref:alpha/beta fold hydrolase n=1 Tax=Gordonibacter sp. TaxID=1968902 RepID=UPI002FCA0B26